MLYPIGTQSFETIIERGYVYLDKTDLVYDLAQQHVCFLSRPRRFGKSLLLSTLDAYFRGRRELFRGLKMERLEKEWAAYPVFRIDFSNGSFSSAEGFLNNLNACLCDWERIYGKDPNRKELGDRFRYVLEAACRQTGRGAVVLIDEYDKPLLDVLGEPQEQVNRDILKAFYGTFKAADDSLRFVLLTGVTKFSQISVFSGFNQPMDISMDSHYDAICGITEEELYTVLAEPIRELAEREEVTEAEMKEILKKQYDGYHFSNVLRDIYNPFSLLNAFSQKNIDDYWFRSGTPTYLAKLIRGHRVNLNEMIDRAYKTSQFVDYRASAEDPLAMFYQAGYLTIRAYDKRNRLYTLDYPNAEVREGFVALASDCYFDKPEDRSRSWVIRLSGMLDRGDLEGIRDAYTAFLASIPYEANKDERAMDYESHYQYTFYLINRLLSCYTTLYEKQNSHGRSDVIIECDRHVYIFEFKLDGSAAEALSQIDRQGYAGPYTGDTREVHCIGVNISSRTGTVTEWQEKGNE